MADSTTPNYGWAYPTVNADADTWGTTLNAALIAADATVKANADTAAAAVAGKMPVNNATATGTFTGPDAGTWSSVGLATIAKLGVGMTASFILDITQNQNSGSAIALLNNNTGTGAAAELRLANATHVGELIMYGTGWTTSGISRQDGLLLSSPGAGGLTLNTSGSQPIYLGIGSAEKARIGTDGSLLVGSTTNAGAGAIGATGNITAFYSDDRLKTRQGNIEGALEKVLSLQGFYYGPNDTARALGYDYEREVGISAQDVQKVMPEVIAPAPIDSQYMTVRYDRLIPLLIEAIKELNAKVAA